jgi:ligand-binding sensor domain-containing protein
MFLRLFFLFNLLSVVLLSQNYVLKQYSVAEGLPQSQVYDIIEDHNGQIWLATRGGGLAKFNGTEFKVYSTDDGLVNNFVSALYQDRRKNIWVGTSNGVSQYNGIKFKSYLLEGENFSVTVSSIAELGDVLYLGTSNGVYRRVNKDFINVSNELGLPGFSVTDVFFDKHNVLWVTHNKGVSKIDGENTIHFSNDLIIDAYPQCMAQSQSGEIWSGTYGKGVFKFFGTKLKQIEKLNGLIVLNILTDDDWLWLSTLKNGVLKYHIKTEKIVNLQQSDQFFNKNCRLTFKDSWGSYWIGTSGGGLIKYAQSPIKSYTEADGLQGNYIYALAASSDSGMWVSTGKKKLQKFKNGLFEEYGVQQNIYSLKIKALFEDSKKRLWIGTEGSGLMLYENGETTFYKAGKELGSNFVKDVIEDRKGNIWIATSNGISKISPQLKNIKQFSRKNNNIHFNRVNTLWEDRSGKIWYGTHGKGIGIISEGSFEVLDLKSGLSSNIIRDLTEDKKGNLYIATAGTGVDVVSPYIQPYQIVNLSYQDGLSSINIYSIFCDSNNVLWVGGDKGVDKISKPNNTKRIVTNFGYAEGFTGVESSTRAVDVDANGDIWWGTVDGLMKTSFQDYNTDKVQPKLSLSSVNLFYHNIQGTRYEPHILNWYQPNNLELEYSDNHIGFELNGIDLKQPEGIKYKWRLDGGSGRWTPASKQGYIFFSNLSPGHYIFQAKAINKNGIESDELRFFFVVKSPFYFTWWFCSIIAMLLIGLSFFGIRYRIDQVKKKAKTVTDKLELEKEVLELEQKTLRLQMNPHFIFNALNAIQDQIRENNNKNARYSLMKFSKLMRQILEHSMEERISLEQEISLIENYLSIEKITRENSFEFNVSVADNIDIEEEGIPPMLIQPFLENAIIHGIAGDSNVGLVDVNFSINESTLTVEVIDNGVGREKANALKSQTGQQHKSLALNVIQNRLQNMGKDSVSGSYTISDVLAAGIVRGTKVTLVLSRAGIY